MKYLQDKNSIKYQLQRALAKAAFKVAGVKMEPEEIVIEHPENMEFGDYASNLVLILLSKIKTKSKTIKIDQLADDFAKFLNQQNLDFIDKVSVKNNFLNISIKFDYLITSLKQVINDSDNYGWGLGLKGKKILVEYAHPNTHKAFHIGHLRNITTGESLVRILEAGGAKVIRANYEGDVGMHIAKCIYGILLSKDYLKLLNNIKTVQKKIDFLSSSYVKGNQAYETNKQANAAIKDINYLIYAAAQEYQEKKFGRKPGSTDYLKFVKGKAVEVEKVYDLWLKTRQWSLDYFETIYQRVDTKFDRYYFESECLAGIDESLKALKKGVLTKSKGAVVFKGEPYGLDTRVFINSKGLPTYEGKELALAPVQFSEHGHLDKLIHVVAPEHKSFFAVTFKVEELLGIQKDQQYHLAYGWVRLKKGKMSSRQGNIILGEWLLDEAKKRIKKSFKTLDDKTAEMIAVGAVKYSFLKQGIGKDMAFDFEESISLSGDSGPYLQYTYARCQSVLARAKVKDFFGFDLKNLKLGLEEELLLRTCYIFPEIVAQAGEQYAPSLIGNFLHDLAQKYNTFYNKYKILKAESKDKLYFRLLLTAVTAQIIKNGLYLLGIKAPEEM